MTIKANDILYAGIDGGGTKCRVRIESASGQLLGSGLGGTANPSHGLATVVKSIMTAVDNAFSQANLPYDYIKNLVVGAGLAGLHLPKYLDLMKSWQHPFKALFLTDDLYAAMLGAHDGGDGGVAIVGTGFSALSVVNGKQTAIGGHGFLMADCCSGSWLGYQAVQAVLLAQDHLAKPTQLTELLYEIYKVKGLELANRLVGASACEYGTLAPLVFLAAKNGDQVAQQILAASAEFLQRVITLLAATKPPRIALIGSVAEQLIKHMDDDLVALVSSPIYPPEVGAIHFAKKQYQQVWAGKNDH